MFGPSNKDALMKEKVKKRKEMKKGDKKSSFIERLGDYIAKSSKK